MSRHRGEARAGRTGGGLRGRGALAALLALCAGAFIPAREASAASRRIRLGPGSSLYLEGTSTLHPYASTATRLAGAGELEAPDVSSAAGKALWFERVKSFELTVPVRGLESGKSRLDENMREALKAGEHPDIVFELTGYGLEPAREGEKEGLVRIEGRLSVAGKDRRLEMRPALEAAGVRVRVRGSQKLLMTDFGIKPPSMFLGALKTDDRVVVHYDLTLEPEEGVGAGAAGKRRLP